MKVSCTAPLSTDHSTDHADCLTHSSPYRPEPAPSYGLTTHSSHSQVHTPRPSARIITLPILISGNAGRDHGDQVNMCSFIVMTYESFAFLKICFAGACIYLISIFLSIYLSTELISNASRLTDDLMNTKSYNSRISDELIVE